MATFNAKAKPYKLKATDDVENITRDDIATWSYTMQSCARQIRLAEISTWSYIGQMVFEI